MTHIEYAEYEQTVKEFFAREGIQNLTRIPTGEDSEEPFFSWSPCDCCQTHLGGSRIEANGYNPTSGEIQAYVICTDCEYYVEYGQLDDMTMMEVRKSANAQ